MYRNVDDFLKDWKTESEATLKILNALTDLSLDQKVSPAGRSLRRLAWHVVLSVGEMMEKVGFKPDYAGEKAAPPTSVADISGAYEKVARSVADQVAAQWKDASLQEEVDMYGEKWANGTTLQVLIRHQTHHRGQMTVLMRQAGLKVPGIYGPAREEWAAFGMPPEE